MDDREGEQNALVKILKDPRAEAQELDFSLLQEITAKFSKEREIGKGTYGVVYRGELRNGMKVAIKTLDSPGQILDDKIFYEEVNCLKDLQNKNIVRFLGYCVHADIVEYMVDGKMVPVEINRKKLLCFEFAPHGTVQKAGASHGAKWPERYQMIKGICHGLECIHNAGYLHLDLKPENILVGEDMVPKIADFGVSRFFGDRSTYDTSQYTGTSGYVAPEFINKGTVSKKSDIFSLGVVIFELVTGTKGPDIHETTQEQKEVFLQKALLDWNRELSFSHRGRSLELAYQQVETCIKIALNCTDLNRDLRRPIKEIAHILDLALDPQILDPRTTEIEAVVVEHFDLLKDMDVHQNEPWILLIMSTGRIEILNYNTKESLGSIELSGKPDVAVPRAKFMKGDGRNIVAGDSRGFIHVYHLTDVQPRTCEKVKSIMAIEGEGITSLAVHPSKPYLLLSTGSSILVWNTESWTCTRMHRAPGYFKTVTHATFNTNDDRTFGIVCCDGTVKLWSNDYDAANRRPYLVLGDQQSGSEQVCSIDYFTCNSAMFLVTGSMDKTAKVWKYDAKASDFGLGLASITKPEATLKHGDGVTATCYNAKLKILITGTNDGVVSVWSSQNYWRKSILCFGLGRIVALACIAGRRILIGHDRGLVLLEIDPKQLSMKLN